MAFADSTWYCSFGNGTSTGYFAVAQFAASTAYSAGQLVRQLTAPAVGSERVFVVIVAGTSSTEPSWTVTRGAKNTSGTVTFQECTGASSLNGDLINTPNWTTQKATGTPTLGAIIKRNNSASYQICSTAGTLGASEPAFSDTAGTTTTEGTTTWTSLGVVTAFTGGQAPHARLANACATNWFAAGNTIYVGDNHAESQATAIGIAPALSTSTVGKIICHNHSGSYPPASSDLRTNATISTTAAAGITFTMIGGGLYVYGLALQAGVGFSTGVASITLTCNVSNCYFDTCFFKLADTGVGVSAININALAAAGTIFWNNCTVSFGNAANFIATGDVFFTWQNTGQVLGSGSAVPGTLITETSNGCISNITLEVIDLSQITGILINTGTPQIKNLLIKDCKLNASMTIPNPSTSGYTVQLVRSDSSGTAYKSARYQYEGTETTETSITRVGGASDPAGQAQSRKIVTTANAQWLRPFKAEPYAIWNPTTGSNVTVTVCGTINAGALPNNDDIWLEVEYLGSASTPLGTIVTTTKANLLAANAAVASDSSSWNGFTNAMLDGFSNAVTVSNNFLTGTLNASLGANYAWALSASAQTTGKYYFEGTAVAFHGNGNGCGIALPTVTSANIGSSQNITGVFTGGTVASNNANVSGANLGAATTGDVYCIAVDLTARLGWLRRNGGNWNNSGTANPATGTGGLTLQAASAFAPIVFFGGGSQVVGDAFTANFGATAYAQTPPSGFGNWPVATGAWTPFKLTATLSAPQPGLAGYLHARVRVAKPSMTVFVDPQITLS